MVWDFFKSFLFSKRTGSVIRTLAWLCAGGVFLGSMAMLVVLSVMNGFGDAIRNRLLSVEPHLVAEVPRGEVGENWIGKVEGLVKSWPGGQAHLLDRQDIMIRTVDGLFGGAVGLGVDPLVLERALETSYKNDLADSQTQEKIQKVPFHADSESHRSGIFIGTDLARSLGVFEGDEVTLISPEALLLPPGETPTFEKVTVIRVIRTNVPDIDGHAFYYVRGRLLKRFHDSASLESAIEIRTDRPELAENLVEPLKKMGLSSRTWKDRNSSLFYSLKMEKLLMGIFLGLVLFIASFSIVIVLVLLGTQKRKEIGLLMSLGLSPRRATAIFTGLGLLLSGIGMFGGLAAGGLICFLISQFEFLKLPEIYYDTRIPVTVDPNFVLGIIGFCTLVAFFSAWLPARISTRMSPSAALRS